MQPQVCLEDRLHCTMCILPGEQALSAQRTPGVGCPLLVLKMFLFQGLTTGFLLDVMMEEMGLVDVWRQKHPKEQGYTFFSKVHGSYSRIDMLCMLTKIGKKYFRFRKGA